MTPLPLAGLLPHAGPMLFLDELLERGPDWARCRGLLRPDNPLLDEGRFPAWGLIEHLAQAAAALQASPGTPPLAGALVAVREARFSGEARPGELVEVMVRRQSQRGSFVGFEGEARAGECSCGARFSVRLGDLSI